MRSQSKVCVLGMCALLIIMSALTVLPIRSHSAPTSEQNPGSSSQASFVTERTQWLHLNRANRGNVPSTTALVSAPTTTIPSSPSVVTTTTFTAASPPTSAPTVPSTGIWSRTEASWYGPGFYGNGTACGQTYDQKIIGVAHLARRGQHLPCGKLIAIRVNGQERTVPIIDRGPYNAGRLWDLSRGLCEALNHCFTGSVEWRAV